MVAALGVDPVDSAQFSQQDTEPMTEERFNVSGCQAGCSSCNRMPGLVATQDAVQDGLGPHGLHLLERDIRWLQGDVTRLLPYFADLTSGRF